LSQLDMFTKRKAKRPPAPPEMAIHCVVADALRVSARAGWVWFHVPNGELRTDATGQKLKRMGVKPGVSDFILVGGGGRVHALELKARNRKPTEAQYEFLLAIEAAGGLTAWTDQAGEALRILKEWGALRIKLD